MALGSVLFVGSGVRRWRGRGLLDGKYSCYLLYLRYRFFFTVFRRLFCPGVIKAPDAQALLAILTDEMWLDIDSERSPRDLLELAGSEIIWTPDSWFHALVHQRLTQCEPQGQASFLK